MLLIYAYGTNTGVRAVAAGDHVHSEDDLRYIRSRYFTVPACREVARAIANATVAARQSWLWGEGSIAVASDSTHFTAFDQNIFTEWHSRLPARQTGRADLLDGREQGRDGRALAIAVLLRLRSPPDGRGRHAARHTDMTIESNYVDSHGASFIGFSIPRLLGFDLIARLLNVVENYNGVNDYIHSASPANSRPTAREEHELSMICLQILQSSLGFVFSELRVGRITLCANVFCVDGGGGEAEVIDQVVGMEGGMDAAA